MKRSGKRELSPRVKAAVARLNDKKSLKNLMALGREGMYERKAYEKTKEYEIEKEIDRRQLRENLALVLFGISVVFSIVLAIGSLLDFQQWLRWGKDQIEDCVKLEHVRWGERSRKGRTPLLLTYTTKTGVRVVDQWVGITKFKVDKASTLANLQNRQCVTVWYEPGQENKHVTLSKMRAPYTELGGPGQFSLLIGFLLWFVVWRLHRGSR